MPVFKVKPFEGEGGGGGSQLYYISVYGMVGGYATSITLQVDEDSLETYNDLYSYLQNKGFDKGNGGNATKALNGCGLNNESDSYIGITIDTFDEVLCIIGVYGSITQIDNDEEFSITYLGQE